MVMTDCRAHSPEIVFLRDGVKVIMNANDVAAYSAAVVGYCILKKHKPGCERGAVYPQSDIHLKNGAALR